MNAASRARSAGSPSVVEYCSARVASGPDITSAKAAASPATSNVSGAGSPPASEITSGRMAIWSSSRTGEECVSFRRRASGAPARGAGGEMAMASRQCYGLHQSEALVSLAKLRPAARPSGALGRRLARALALAAALVVLLLLVDLVVADPVVLAA